MKAYFLIFFFVTAGKISLSQHFKKENNRYVLTTEGASHLAGLPLKCIQQSFPYKTGVVFSDTSLITLPKNYHPIFYGCFDWHSSAHGHWMLIRLLKKFPDIPQADTIRTLLREQLTAANVQKEAALFQQKENKSFERTYGWAWIMQMQKELLEWDDSLGRELAGNLQPLTILFSKLYI